MLSTDRVSSVAGTDVWSGSWNGQLIPRATPTRTHRIGPQTSLYNDYLINIVVTQQHAELLARAAEDRLARQLPWPVCSLVAPPRQWLARSAAASA